MHLNEPILMELAHEMANTRKTLERVDEAKFGWKPHAKSMTYGRLASHLAEIPGWLTAIVTMDVLDMQSSQAPFDAKSSQELLKTFDEGLAQATAALKTATNEQLMGDWEMTMDGNPFIKLPRMVVIRTWVLSHSIHHRGQLSVYLRLNDAPVPALYGPSADEQG